MVHAVVWQCRGAQMESLFPRGMVYAVLVLSSMLTVMALSREVRPRTPGCVMWLCVMWVQELEMGTGSVAMDAVVTLVNRSALERGNANAQWCGLRSMRAHE